MVEQNGLQNGWCHYPVCLTILLLSMQVQAQIPEYFERGQMWSYFTSASISNGCALYNDNVLYVDEDTLIQGRTYKRIGKRGRSREQNAGPPPWNCDEQWYYFDETFCYISQTSDSILVHGHPDLPNGVLISYALNIGDTVADTPFQWVVHSIDTILINNIPHRRFFTDVQEQEYLIEGVAHALSFGTYPLLYQFVQGGLGPLEMTCFAENDTSVWFNPLFDPADCNYFIALGVNDPYLQLSSVELFPNPATSHMNIVVHGPGTYSITLFNVLGERVLFESNAKNVDVSGLAIGTYIAQVNVLDHGRSFRERIIVAH